MLSELEMAYAIRQAQRDYIPTLLEDALCSMVDDPDDTLARLNEAKELIEELMTEMATRADSAGK